jgi:hypothetical protein
MTKIKTCPFCSEEPKLREIIRVDTMYQIKCSSPKCSVGPSGRTYMDKRKAVQAWNRRIES